jgi:F-type H+-transporting ATPase subunit b
MSSKYKQIATLFIAPLLMVLVLNASDLRVENNNIQTETADNVEATPVGSVTSTVLNNRLQDIDLADEPSKGHHPEVKIFGKPIGVLAQFGVTVFNFLLFFGILFFTLKGSLSSIFKTQKEDLKNRLFKSERDKEEARRKVCELEVRMAGLQQELDGLMAKTEMDASFERNQILEAAQVEAARIISQTRVEIDLLKQNAKAELHAMVVELVVAKATQHLNMQLNGDLATAALDQAIEKVRDNK